MIPGARIQTQAGWLQGSAVNTECTSSFDRKQLVPKSNKALYHYYWESLLCERMFWMRPVEWELSSNRTDQVVAS